MCAPRAISVRHWSSCGKTLNICTDFCRVLRVTEILILIGGYQNVFCCENFPWPHKIRKCQWRTVTPRFQEHWSFGTRKKAKGRHFCWSTENSTQFKIGNLTYSSIPAKLADCQLSSITTTIYHLYIYSASWWRAVDSLETCKCVELNKRKINSASRWLLLMQFEMHDQSNIS
jgi:hypothetical protein